MKIRFWGVRGSIPIPGHDTIRYGGNTPCIEVTSSTGDVVILDAGTGLRCLGIEMMKRGALPSPIHLLISHTHWDHIQGFPFFAPCYVPGAVVHVRGPVHFRNNRSLQHVFEAQMQYEFFPVSNTQLAATITYDSLAETTFPLGSLTVTTQFMNHSVQAIGYQLREQDTILVYTGDHEPYYDVFHADPAPHESEDDLLFGDTENMVQNATERFLAFLSNADLAIMDCQYTPEEYPAKKRTWGHSSWDYCLDWMHKASVKRMVLTHHDPLRTDDALDALYEHIRTAAASRGIDPDAVCLACEGMEITI